MAGNGPNCLRRNGIAGFGFGFSCVQLWNWISGFRMNSAGESLLFPGPRNCPCAHGCGVPG